MITDNPLNKLMNDLQTPTETRISQHDISGKDTVENQTPEATKTDVVESSENVEIITPVSEKSLTTTTDWALAMLDFSQQNLFRGMIKGRKNKRIKELFPVDGKKRLETVLGKTDAGQTDLSDDEFALLKIHKKAEVLISELALTDDETKVLYEPLKNYIKEKGGEIPKELMAFFGAIQIFGGRAMDIMQL